MHTDSQRIIELENRFWQLMIDRNTPALKGLIADDCLVAGPQGTMRIDPDTFGRMMDDGDWRLDRFELSDCEVIFPTDDTAVITYKVHECGRMKESPMDLTCADASTWVRENGKWKCSLHTETILQDASATRH